MYMYMYILRLLFGYSLVENVSKKGTRLVWVLSLQGGSLYAVYSLVESGANVRAVDEGGRSAMHLAAQVGAV